MSKTSISSRRKWAWLVGTVVLVLMSAVPAIGAGLNPFADVPDGRYFSDPVAWAFENGITTGKTSDLFDPAGGVTRGESVTFLKRYHDNVVGQTVGSLSCGDRQVPVFDASTDSWVCDIGGGGAAGTGTAGPAGPAGPTGLRGLTGPSGASGPTNRISDSQIATLAWYEDPAASASIVVGDQPLGVAFDGNHIWVANYGDWSVSRIDPETNTVVATVYVHSDPWGVIFDGTFIWVSHRRASGIVTRIDPTTLRQTFAYVGASPEGLAFDGSHVWVANNGSESISKIEPSTAEVVATVTVGWNPRALAFDGTHLWVATDAGGAGEISKIALSRSPRVPDTVVDTVGLGNVEPSGIIFDGTDIWVSSYAFNRLARIEPDTARATWMSLGDAGYGARGLAYDGTNIWVVRDGGGVLKVERALSGAISLLRYPDGAGAGSALAFDGTSIWATGRDADSVWRITE